ncbi:hypothetical protein COCCADRAFT_86668 [Bipolaris zeicola 26-R-13]|uniref:DUF3669 domain-containing protein n=1 Tax=Cochliobolus carbonum (strain 26-R-13) TaxID=930089 RepID=W6YHK2_COCC2|nr:uncharacterized protein COCCADRAFT_86668 [Bipolaris zeicola 26-R-13]EUC37020.1 hypothetical protein COCCADRAFT_86668 [Bipolaris zeicola 26-R-13]
MQQTNARYRCIGKGFCGSVWTLEDSTRQTAIKREDGGPGRSVTNDYNMHVKVVESTQQHQPLSTPLCIPQCQRLIQASDPWWHTSLAQFPPGYSPCRALASERTPKVLRSTSDKLVDLFCAGNTSLSEFVKGNPDDDACLIRPYLGRRRRHRQDRAGQSRFQRFSLRNVPLHVDQMEVLGLDVRAYAGAMAEALALMHWGARIDANDVEFVLAPPRAGHAPTFESEYLGVHCMWILDFDCCRPIQIDETGAEQACVAFYKNDPFYPKPGTGEAADEELWALFKGKFLESSHRIMGEASQEKWFLADMLVERIEEEGRSRRKDKEAGTS